MNPVSFIDDEATRTERLDRDLGLATRHNDIMAQLFADQADEVVALNQARQDDDALIDWLHRDIAKLKAENARLRARIAQLDRTPGEVNGVETPGQ